MLSFLILCLTTCGLYAVFFFIHYWYALSFEMVLMIPDIAFCTLLGYFFFQGLFTTTTATVVKNVQYFPITSGHYSFVLGSLMFITGMAQLVLGYFLMNFYELLLPETGVMPSLVIMPAPTLFYYNTINVGSLFLKLKGFLSLIVSFILLLIPKYLQDNRLNNYEFSFIIAIALISL